MRGHYYTLSDFKLTSKQEKELDRLGGLVSDAEEAYQEDPTKGNRINLDLALAAANKWRAGMHYDLNAMYIDNIFPSEDDDNLVATFLSYWEDECESASDLFALPYEP